jgi:hypothetical protein
MTGSFTGSSRVPAAMTLPGFGGLGENGTRGPTPSATPRADAGQGPGQSSARIGGVVLRAEVDRLPSLNFLSFRVGSWSHLDDMSARRIRERCLCARRERGEGNAQSTSALTGGPTAGRLLRELSPGGDAQLGEDVGEVGLHSARRDEQAGGDVAPLTSPFNRAQERCHRG